MDELDFLDGQEPAATTAAAPPAEAPAVEPPTEAAPAEGPVRDDKGRFAPKAPTEAQAAPDQAADPQAPVTSPAAPQDQKATPDGFVPLSAFTKLREEFNAYKQQNQRPAEPPPPAPDPYEDFEAYERYQQNQALAERADWSFQLAVARHGEERANEVKAWAAERFASDPVFAQRAMSSRDPYGVAIDEWKREQVFSRLSDPALLEKVLALTSGQQTPAAATPPAPPPPNAPPPSITSAPSAGGVQHVPLGQSEVYGSIFN